MKVTVVGAGIIGCAVAYELARRGARVHVVDPRTPGQGATRASAGILAPYIEGHVPSLLKLGVRSLALYDEFVQRVSADGGTDVEFARCGTLQVAVADAENMRLEDWRQGTHLRVKGARRPLRFQPHHVNVSAGEDDLGIFVELRFQLESGCYATTVLREICKSDNVSAAPES